MVGRRYFYASWIVLLAAQPLLAQGIGTARVASGLSKPVFVTAPAGDGSRLFAVEQGTGGSANIKIINLTNNTVGGTPFLTVTGLATTNGEQGLLGLAFHPDYATNGKFYVNVTAPGGSFGNGITQIREYQATGPNYLTATTANPVSTQTLLSFDQPQVNHNGGWIGFNPKLTPSTSQYLYIASGDGGNSYDQGTGHTEPEGNAERKDTMLGKIIRIDPNTDDFPGDSTKNYAIPPSNPYAGATPGNDELWSIGLRNPWRASFDRQNGDFYIGDVGQDQKEEIDYRPASSPGGENYGWRLREGTIQTPGAVGGPAPVGAIEPIHDYNNPVSGLAAVVGGYVYRGTELPGAWQGTYFFSDTYNGKIWGLTHNGVTSTVTDLTAQMDPPGALAISSVVSFGESAMGELFVIDYADGEVYKVVPEPAGLSLIALAGVFALRRKRAA